MGLTAKQAGPTPPGYPPPPQVVAPWRVKAATLAMESTQMHINLAQQADDLEAEIQESQDIRLINRCIMDEWHENYLR